MQSLALVFIAFLLGLAAKKMERFPQSTGKALNAFVISVSLPALILTKIPVLFQNQSSEPLLWLAPVSMWVKFLIAWALLHFIGNKLNWSRAKTGALILVTGLANTSFVGFPLLQSTLGLEAIPYAILADQLGEFLIVSTLGIFIASLYSGAVFSPQSILKKLFSFPPFISLIFAFALSFYFPTWLPSLDGILQPLASTLVPLALFAVGFNANFALEALKRRWRPLSIGLSLRLVLIPILFIAVFRMYFGPLDTSPLIIKVTLLETAMASQITAGVVANEFHLDGELANLMVGLSILLSLFTIPIWNSLLF